MIKYFQCLLKKSQEYRCPCGLWDLYGYGEVMHTAQSSVGVVSGIVLIYPSAVETYSKI